MLDRLVRDGELCEVVANHLRLDLNLVEGLAIVDTDDATNHLRHNDHVAEVGPDGLWLFTSRRSFFCLNKFHAGAYDQHSRILILKENCCINNICYQI